MTQLRIHPLPDLVAANATNDAQACRPAAVNNAIRPGDLVRHKNDPDSYGMCLSRCWIWDDKPVQCSVLWSREPVLLDTHKNYTKVLSRKFDIEEATSPIYDSYTSRSHSSFTIHEEREIEEERAYIDADEEKRLREQGDHVEFRDGRVIIVRKRSGTFSFNAND